MSTQLIGLYSAAPGSGKTAVANALRSCGFAILPFASPLKKMLAAMLSGVGYSEFEIYKFMHEDKEQIIPEFGVSTRHMLRTLGTEWGRSCVGPDVWLTHWRIRAQQYTYIVVDDVRFQNEAYLIKKMGGIMWKIMRPGVERASEHASEGGLDAWPCFDACIVNDGTLEQLTDAVASIPLRQDGSDTQRLWVASASKDQGRLS